jgi:HEAT repeat protein
VPFYCWQCYALSDRSRGKCVACGGEIAAPADAGFTEKLLWSLHHPLPDRQLTAARVLGERQEQRAREPLRELALNESDPYLAAEALKSLVAIDGAEQLRDLLEQLADTGSPPVKRVAKRALTARLGPG